MLREMGVIKEGDNHFYRQHELEKLVSSSDLNNEQKQTIQEWANDRDSRVANLKNWQEDHPVHNEPSANADTNTNPDTVISNTDEGAGNSPTKEEDIIQRLYSVKGKLGGNKYNGEQASFSASTTYDVARRIRENAPMDGKLDIVDENGNKSHLKMSDNKSSLKSTIKNYEDGKKVLTESSKTYKDDGHTRTKIKTDFDGDGKKDKIYDYTSKEGNTIRVSVGSQDG